MSQNRRAALYARVSTKEQNPDAQVEPLRRHAEARGFVVVPDGDALAFVDHGVSGAKTSRPGLDRMMALVRRRDVDVVVAVRLDRLARSVRHLLDMAEELRSLGVDLVLLDQGIDTSTPAGQMTFTVLGAIAEFERALLRERTIAGMEAARRKGHKPGRRPALSDSQRARIRRLAEGGKSVTEVARIVGGARATVAREMQRQRVEG